MTLIEWIRCAGLRLRRARLNFGHGTSTPDEEAAWIAAHSCRLSPRRLERHWHRTLTTSEVHRAEKLVAERISRRVPAAYVLGEAWLGGHRFYVDERVIVPRSFIADVLSTGLQPWVGQRSSIRKCLDLCTGSGCLAILAAKAFPSAQVLGVDISKSALQVAKINVANANLRKRVRLLHSDLFSRVRPAQRYELIISNPPYVTTRDMNRLPPEYRQEPSISLAGGADGLSVIQRIILGAHRYLTTDGVLVMEIGHNKRALERAFPRTAFTWIDTIGGSNMVFMLNASALPHGYDALLA